MRLLTQNTLYPTSLSASAIHFFLPSPFGDKHQVDRETPSNMNTFLWDAQNLIHVAINYIIMLISIILSLKKKKYNTYMPLRHDPNEKKKKE